MFLAHAWLTTSGLIYTGTWQRQYEVHVLPAVLCAHAVLCAIMPLTLGSEPACRAQCAAALCPVSKDAIQKALCGREENPGPH